MIRPGSPLAWKLLEVGFRPWLGNRLRPSAYLSAAPLRTLRLDDAVPSTGVLQTLVEKETHRIQRFLSKWGEEAPERWGGQDSSSRPS